MIDDSVCEGVFKQIYDRPKSQQDVQGYDHRNPSEIIRYGTNCYSHVNDYEYRNVRTSQVCLVS